VLAPQENNAMSIPLKSAPTTSSTTTSPSQKSVRPADLALAKKRMLSAGNRLSARIDLITAPT
jgi:hypothetical protein